MPEASRIVGGHARVRFADSRQHKQTVEPVFGIIKEVLGFRRFRLRGKDKASLEWTR
jgi:hypothetical protein